MTFTDTQRARRGHDFLPTGPDAENIPALGATEDSGVDTADKNIVLHYMVGSCDWWLIEADLEQGLGFGYACLGDPDLAEWGSVDLAELEAVTVGGFHVVERDLYWTVQTVRDANLPGLRA